MGASAEGILDASVPDTESKSASVGATVVESESGVAMDGANPRCVYDGPRLTGACTFIIDGVGDVADTGGGALQPIPPIALAETER